MESKIEKLLHKYWESESSLEEENELKTLLSESQDEHFAEEKELFSHFQNEATIELDSSFDDELLAQLEAPSETKVLRFSDFVKRYSSIAAAVLVLFVSSYIFIEQQKTYEAEDTFATPEEAYAELKKQLLMVSRYMNKGNETVSELSNLGKFGDVVNDIGTIERASETTFGHLKELNRTN